MISVTGVLPNIAGGRPPVILIHGAANSAVVWTFWQRELAQRGWASYAIDLRGHGASDAIDLSGTRMKDYAEDARRLVGQLRERPVVIGWSMGALVALMVAASGSARACVGLAPSAPARAEDPNVPLRAGEFGPEEYDITSRDPADHDGPMPDLDREERLIARESLGKESRMARDERKRGVVLESVSCPLLIATVTADLQWPRERYSHLHLRADFLELEGASHWGLVLNRRALAEVVPTVVRWMELAVAPAPALVS